MDMELKRKFTDLWERYFNGHELPFVLMYSQDPLKSKKVYVENNHDCLTYIVSHARAGKNIYIESDSLNCSGGKKSLGFDTYTDLLSAYLMSNCNDREKKGNDCKKKTRNIPEWVEQFPTIQAPGPKAVFKRWDRLEESDDPEVVIFFADPNELSALFTLANFEESNPHNIKTPFCPGCASLAMFPMQEKFSQNPKPIVGMLNISTRPYVPQSTFSFAVPFEKFEPMVENMDNSFLAHETWQKAQIRYTYPSARKYNRLRCHF
ncbi:MAG: DUF169 domain-containing protein [Desulfohalobiaceae bacterium]